MLREIDRALVNLRREEANGCMYYRLYHAATLAAGSGVELLLECLVVDLHRVFQVDEPENAKTLKRDLDDFAYERGEIRNWGLGVWCEFYSEYQIPFKLHDGLGYKSEWFSERRIRNVVKEWNRCKHDVHEALPSTARDVVDYLNELLDNVGVQSSLHRGKNDWRQEWGDQVDFWTVQNRDSAETELLRNLFPLLGVVEQLISDKRVGYEHKTRLMLAENYVFSTIDLVKEDKRRPHSLVDDAAVLALTLQWLLHQPSFDKSAVQDCRQLEPNVEDQVSRLSKFIFRNHDKLFLEAPGHLGSQLVWAAIKRISEVGPEALWQNYWKEAY